MILKGYLIIFLYIFFLILVLGPIAKKIFNLETSRKLIHTLLFAVWIFIDIYLKNTIHQIIIPIIFLIINTISYKFSLFKSIEREENNHLGTIYFAIAITIIMALAYKFPSLYYATGIATFALTFGDGAAALVGYNTKSKKIIENKSLIGFLACFLATSVSTFIFANVYNLNLTIGMCLILGLLASIFELVGKGLDNFSIVGITLIASYLFLKFPSNLLTLTFITAILMFFIVFFSKSFTYYGSILSMFIAFSYMYFGRKIAVVVLLGEYFIIFFVSLIKKMLKKKKKDVETRNILQIIINGLLSTVFIIIYGITKETKFLIVGLISVSGCFVDSISSDVGTLSNKKPFDIFKMKSVPRGISGGMSFLGTFSSLIISILIGFYIYKSLKLNENNFILISFLIFFQTIVDSFLGSKFQKKFFCSKCKSINEKGFCCNKESKKISGYYLIDNNAVNMISSIIITAIAYFIYI